MACELRVDIVGNDADRAVEILDLIAGDSDASEVVANGRRFFFLGAQECAEVKANLEKRLDKEAPDWKEHIRI